MPDVFWDLDRVGVGAEVTVACADGTTRALRVTRKASVAKTALQTDASVWGASSTPVVVLITCDRNSPIRNRHRVNNVVVWTAPA